MGGVKWEVIGLLGEWDEILFWFCKCEGFLERVWGKRIFGT